MYVRTTIIQADPAKIEDGIRAVNEQVLPAVTAMDGCVGMSMLVNRSSGRCIATTAWESEDAMQASRERVRPLRDEAIQSFGAAGDSDVREWEVAAVHRDHAAPEGACARVTWLSADPGATDRAVDVYKMAVLPRIQETDGFCSASLMVDRMGGRAVGTVAFDSREAMERSREMANEVRERAAQEIGATIDNVEELEIAFAHLHVPELA